MAKYKVGIVGCGNIFPMHAVSVSGLDQAELAAVCDIKEERAEEKAEEFDVNYYFNYKEMIDEEDLDVVHICTPHHMHAPITIYACRAGKHVITEKPMAIKLEDAEEMVRTAADNNVTLGVIFQNRFNPG
ncbi:MAG: Gfo/Idh/MocA family protein, partial [Halanaerobiales bacterium]